MQLVSGKNKPGLSLIELMVAIAIVALLATIVAPNLRKKPDHKRKNFITQLNSLIKFASNNAVKTGKKHKVEFNLSSNKIFLQKEKKKETFKNIKRKHQATSIKFPKNILLKNVFIKGVDEMTRHGGNKKTNTFWFFIFPNRFTQPVIINAVDTFDKRDNKPKMFSLMLNPFSAQFKTYDSFKKP